MEDGEVWMGAPELTEWLTQVCQNVVLVYGPSLELYAHPKLSFVLRTTIALPAPGCIEPGLLLALVRGDRVIGEVALPSLAGASARMHEGMTQLELYAQGGLLCARMLVDAVYEGLVAQPSTEWN